MLRLTTPKIAGFAAVGRRYAAGDGNGLELSIGVSGRKSWRWRWTERGHPAGIIIGHWPEMALGEARARAEELAAARRRGEDPREAAAPKLMGLTVREFGARWLREMVSVDRKDPAPVERYLKREIYPRLGAKLIDQVRSRDVQRLVFAKRDAGSPASAAAIRDVLKRLWDYAIVCGVAETNPVAPLRRRYVARQVKRDRALSADEIAALIRELRNSRAIFGVHGSRLGIAVELLLLTLARKGELRRAEPRHVDLDRGVWEIPAESDKSGHGLLIYLAPRAIELFGELVRLSHGSSVLLPAHNAVHTPIHAAVLNRALIAIRRRAGLKHFTVHDLRRTAATHLAEMGWEERVIEKALGHGKRGIVGVYNRAEYAAQRREMAEAWAAWIEAQRRR